MESRLRRDLVLVFALTLLFCISANHAQDRPTVTVTPSGFIAGEGTAAVTFTCIVSITPFLGILMRVNGSMLAVNELERTGITTGKINDTVSFLTFPTKAINNNSRVQCVALGESNIFSSNISFLVQGILSPPANLSVMEGSTLNSRRLSWNPPFTLDITDQDPDISGYRICLILTLTRPINSTCVVTQDTSYDLLNISVPFQLSVTALNVAGESSSSTPIIQEACDQAGTAAPDGIDSAMVSVQISVSLNQTHSITVELQQSPSTTCYDIYSIELSTNSTSTSSMDSFRVGPLIPKVTDFSRQTLQLQGLAELEQNTVYNASIIAINTNGETPSSGQVVFGTYDVQEVSISALPGAVEIRCSFLVGSMARGCRVTVCRLRIDGEVDMQRCWNMTLDRSIPTERLRGLEEGSYRITEVADVEDGGEITPISDLLFFNSQVSVSNPQSTAPNPPTATFNTTQTGGLSTGPGANVGVIVGPVLGVVIVLLMAGIVAVILCICCRIKNISCCLYKYNFEERALPSYEGVDGTCSLNNAVAWSKSTENELRGQQVGIVVSVEDAVKPEVQIEEPDSSSLQENIVILWDENVPPELPPKKAASVQHARCPSEPVGYIPPPPEFGEPFHNLSQEDIHEVHISVSPENMDSKLSLERTKTSQESLLSVGSKASVKGEHLTYAEIDHFKMKSNTPRDKNAVLYSEIRVEDIPPILPRKKSRTPC